MTPKSDAKFDEKLTFHLKNDMRNLVNINLSSRKSKNLHFDGLLLLRVCNTSQSSISTHPFSDVPLFSKIYKPTGQKQQIGKQCFLPPLAFKINLRDTSFYISLNSLAFYPSRMLAEFSLTCMGKKFNLWCSYSSKMR